MKPNEHKDELEIPWYFQLLRDEKPLYSILQAHDIGQLTYPEAEQLLVAYIEKVIGADEELVSKSFGLSQEDVFMPSDIFVEIKNQLRAEQRKRLRGKA